MANMYLVCGMSGSGKTTFAKQYAADLNYTYVCPDDYYARINGDECKHTGFFEIWMSMWRDLHNYEVNNIDVVVDTNALTRGQREQFLEWFPTFTHHIVWCEASFGVCLANNNSRRRVIPKEIMEQMWQNIEEPTVEEYSKYKTAVIRTNVANVVTEFRVKE